MTKSTVSGDSQRALSSEAPPSETAKRGAWGGQAEFILTCIGYAVGLGSIWRFPFLCYRNGGGSFVVPYIIMLVSIGIPVFFFELCLGQFSSQGPVSVWAVNPMFKGLGYGMIGVNWLIGLYYNVIISWCFYYFFASMTSHLPWQDCGNPWNTNSCLSATDMRLLLDNVTLRNEVLAEQGLNSTEDFINPSQEYFYNEVIQLSEGIGDTGTVVWRLALCLLLAWIVVFLILIKGINSLGKVMYFVTLFPYAMMVALLVQNCLLPGAREGILFYMTPDWSRLKDASVWSDAATQLFFTLSTCSGGLIAMASYNPFRNNCLRDAILVPVVTVCTSFFAGFVVFSGLGFIAYTKGFTDPTEFSKVVQGGPGLVFIVYPEAITQMTGSTFWAIAFFFMMILLGFSSELSIVESVFVAISDEFPHLLRKTKRHGIIFRAVACGLYFIISLPMVTKGGYYLFNLMDLSVSGFPLLFVGFFELMAIVWVYGYRRFFADVEMMIGKSLHQLGYFVVCWLVVSPVMLLGLAIFKAAQYEAPVLNNVPYPLWAQGLGWAVVTFTLMWIPIVMIFRRYKDGSWKKAMTPLPSWGPAEPENRTGLYSADNKSYSQGVAIIGQDGMPKTTEGGMFLEGVRNPGFSSKESVNGSSTKF